MERIPEEISVVISGELPIFLEKMHRTIFEENSAEISEKILQVFEKSLKIFPKGISRTGSKYVSEEILKCILD